MKTYYHETAPKKKFPWKPFIVTAIVTISLIFVFVGYYQCVYLSLRIFDKQIQSIRYTSYQGDAFVGAVEQDEMIQENTSGFDEMMTQMNYEKICLFHPSGTSQIAFITFTDGSTINAYISDNRIGLDYGRVWLYVENLQEMLTVSE